MKKLAIATAAVALMSLAACGGKPEAEANNAANATVVNATENAANALDNAANATDNAANTAGAVAANAAK